MSITIDPKAGTHFTGKIFVTPHALERAVERFGIDRTHAPMHVMDLLRKSSLIEADALGEDGNSTRIYAYKRTVFIVDKDKDTVITLYPRESASPILQESVSKALRAALTAAQRKEARENKRLSIARATLLVERAEVDLRRIKTASINVAAAMSTRIAEIDAEIRAIDVQIREAKREKTTLANGIAAFT